MTFEQSASLFALVAALIVGFWIVFNASTHDNGLLVDVHVLTDGSGRFDVLLGRARLHGLPTLCKKCDIVRGWKALHLWSPHYLQDKAEQPLLVSMRQGADTQAFIYQRDTSLLDELAAVSDFRRQTLPPLSRVPLDGRAFFTKLMDIEAAEKNDPNYVADELIYYAGGTESFPSIAKADIFPVNESLWLSEHRRDNPVWIGHRSVAVKAHFDYCMNAFVQLYGQKTFCLVPPEQHNYTFPFSHPGYRQSSHDFHLPSRSLSSENGRAHDLAKNDSARALDERQACVTLSPGDVLYVPPFWWHTVKAESVSISISFFTEGPQLAEDELTRLPIPFEETWSDAESRTALAVYVGTYWPEAFEHGRRFRYVPAFGYLADCKQVFDANGALCPPSLIETVGLAQLQNKFRRGFDLVSSTLDRHNITGHAHTLLVATYIDKLMAFFVDGQDINAFAQCCSLDHILTGLPS